MFTIADFTAVFSSESFIFSTLHRYLVPSFNSGKIYKYVLLKRAISKLSKAEIFRRDRG